MLLIRFNCLTCFKLNLVLPPLSTVAEDTNHIHPGSYIQRLKEEADNLLSLCYA